MGVANRIEAEPSGRGGRGRAAARWRREAVATSSSVCGFRGRGRRWRRRRRRSSGSARAPRAAGRRRRALIAARRPGPSTPLRSPTPEPAQSVALYRSRFTRASTQLSNPMEDRGGTGPKRTLRRAAEPGVACASSMFAPLRGHTRSGSAVRCSMAGYALRDSIPLSKLAACAWALSLATGCAPSIEDGGGGGGAGGAACNGDGWTPTPADISFQPASSLLGGEMILFNDNRSTIYTARKWSTSGALRAIPAAGGAVQTVFEANTVWSFAVAPKSHHVVVSAAPSSAAQLEHYCDDVVNGIEPAWLWDEDGEPTSSTTARSTTTASSSAPPRTGSTFPAATSRIAPPASVPSSSRRGPPRS